MYTRTQPYPSRILDRSLLTGPGSTKTTYHIALEAQDPRLSFKVGDSIGVLPSNDPDSVEEILRLIHASGSEEVLDARTSQKTTLKAFLTQKANLGRVNSAFFKFLCLHSAPSELLLPENKNALTAHLDSHSLIDLLHLHKPAPLPPQEFVQPLMPLMPRFYSIASSPKVYPGEIHLTVSYVCYEANGRTRYGVGSHFLCDLAALDETAVPFYVQPSHSFMLPEDPSASLILIGPGTGVAPYRAFLQERIAAQASGRHWLFFGERNRATDFYYGDFWLDLEKQGRLRLDLAFSRDQAEKIYVQHRMLEQKKSLYNWIQNGSYIYVCGDAQEMAKDVEAALVQIFQEEGSLPEEDARKALKSLRAEKRYLLDVY